MRYVITQEIRSPAMVTKGIYVADFFFLICYAGMMMILSSLVNGTLKIPFYIFCAFTGLWLVGSSYKNRKRRNIQSLLIFLRKDRTVYHPVRAVPEQKGENHA